MKNHQGRWAFGFATTLLLLSSAVWAQDSAKSNTMEIDATAIQQSKSSKKDAHKFSLADVTRVSTKDAAKSAAHKAAGDGNKKAAKESEDRADSVTEFTPAPPDTTESGMSKSKQSKKHTGPKIHGDAYGGLDPQNSGTDQTGGSIGATSKSGKTSIYVGGGQTHSTSSTPH